MRRLVLLLTMVWFGISLIGTSSTAFGYSTVLSLGDSLSDTGNIGRYSNGDFWVELLADHYGATHINMAYAGATTGDDNPAAGLTSTGLNWQAAHVAAIPQDTLVTLWAGGNDFLQGRSSKEAAANIITALDKLYSAGARDFLIPNLPDIGNTPQFQILGQPLAAGASAWSLDFNSNLEIQLQGFNNSNSGVNLFALDSFTIFNSFPVGTPEWAELFWIDGFHPSDKGHTLIFEKGLAVIVPEPTSILLFIFGLLGVLLLSRKR